MCLLYGKYMFYVLMEQGYIKQEELDSRSFCLFCVGHREKNVCKNCQKQPNKSWQNQSHD